jgi:hypothetical protein
MRLEEIAASIRAHLLRFEADPRINTGGPDRPGPYYYHPNAMRAGRYVWIRYVGFQGGVNVDKGRAARYLAWLDAGHIGRHWESDPDL